REVRPQATWDDTTGYARGASQDDAKRDPGRRPHRQYPDRDAAVPLKLGAVVGTGDHGGALSGRARRDRSGSPDGGRLRRVPPDPAERYPRRSGPESPGGPGGAVPAGASPATDGGREPGG